MTEAIKNPLQKIAHYEIQDTLGFGSLGTVYRAWDTKLNRIVALKVLSPEIKNDNLRKRFHLEARAIAALKHPSIVQVLDFSDADSATQYIALEHLAGKSLFDLTQDNGPLMEQIALCMAHEVAAALEYAHSQNIVHRDIKPDNVVVEQNRIVLIDFGAMKLVDTHQWIPKDDVDKLPQTIGTPGFMAPEQFVGDHVDHRADIFSVGALLYYITTFVFPYARDLKNSQHIYDEASRGRYQDPRDVHPLLTPGFCDLLARCLVVKPSKRIDSAAQLRLRIQYLIQAHGINDIQKVIKTYTETPRIEQTYELRTIGTLTKELKLALLRDFQRAIHQNNPKDINETTNRLRILSKVFDDADKFSDRDQLKKIRLLKGRLVHRRRWFALGLLLGIWIGVGVSLALPNSADFVRLHFVEVYHSLFNK